MRFIMYMLVSIVKSQNGSKINPKDTEMEVYGRTTSQVAPESVQGRCKGVKGQSGDCTKVDIFGEKECPKVSYWESF